MTDWWNKNAKDRIEDLKSWIKDYDHETKVYCRRHIENNGYKSIIDCGCGIATEYFGFKRDQYDIAYTGLDSCKYFIDLNESNGITMIEADMDQPLPVDSNSFDCVYCREVIEHLHYYENAISSFIDMAKKEVLIGWFIKPTKDEEQINYWPEEDLYHNVYNIDKLEKFIMDNPKVEKLFWHDFNEKESALHIILKDNAK